MPDYLTTGAGAIVENNRHTAAAAIVDLTVVVDRIVAPPQLMVSLAQRRLIWTPTESARVPA